MITVPALWNIPGHRIYRDSADQQLVYVDALEPAPVRGEEAVRWFPLPAERGAGAALEQAYLAGEVGFGPREEGLRRAAETASKRRPVPVPWEAGPVYAWTREDDGVLLLARGKTAGYGAHNAILSGTARAQAMASPVVIAAELSYRGRLAGAALRGHGSTAVVREAVRNLPVGAHASWSATLAEVLVTLFRELVNQRALTLTAESVDLPLAAVEELQALALMEWAHRVAAASAPPESLAMPAARVEALHPGTSLDLAIDWVPGDLIPVRAVRVLRPKHQAAPLADRPARSAKPAGAVDGSEEVAAAEVTVTPDSDWSSFDYVEVALGSGADTTRVTLTKAAPAQRWSPGRREAAALQATAVGAVHGYGTQVPIEDVAVSAGQVAVRLRPVEERALLVREDKALIRQVGPHEVELTHPGLAKVLVPEEGVLAMSPDDGDLQQLSLVYRALLWKEHAAAPFRITVRFPSGPTVSWTDPARNAEVVVARARLPLLRVVAVSPFPSGAVEVELAQRASEHVKRRRSLGRKEMLPESEAAWVYDPAGGELLMRSRYTSPDGMVYRTAWHPARPNGTVLAPRAQLRKVAVVLSDESREILDVELAPLMGQGGKVRITVAAGQPRTVTLLDDAAGGATRYRTRIREEGGAGTFPWSPWTSVEGGLIRLKGNPRPG